MCRLPDSGDHMITVNVKNALSGAIAHVLALNKERKLMAYGSVSIVREILANVLIVNMYQ